MPAVNTRRAKNAVATPTGTPTTRNRRGKAGKQTPPAKPVEEEESGSESEQEEAAPVVTPKGKKTPTSAKKSPAKREREESDSDDENESDDEPAPKKVSPAKKQKKTPAKKEESESEEEKAADDDDDSSDEEEEEAPAKNGKQVKAAPLAEAEEESDSDDEEDKPAAKETMETEEADSDDESDSDEESSDSDTKKRKKKEQTEKPAKKTKTEKASRREQANEQDTLTLFVRGFPKGIEDAKIEKFFKKRGIELAAVRQVKKTTYVDLANASFVQTALALHGTEYKGEELTIEKALPKKETPKVEGEEKKTKKSKKEADDAGAESGSADETPAPAPVKEQRPDRSATSLYVKNLSYNIDEEEVREAFPGCASVDLISKNGKRMGYGYIRYDEGQNDLMEKHLSELQGMDLDGRAIFIDKAAAPRSRDSFGAGGRGGGFGGTPRGGRGGFAGAPRGGGGGGRSQPDGPTKTLIIKSLNYDTTWQGLKDAFKPYNCTHSRVLTDRETGRSRGMGFVEFQSPDDAQSALNSMNQSEIDGRTIICDFALDRDSMPPREGGGFGGRGGGGFGGRGGGRGRGGGGGFGGRGGRGGGKPLHMTSGVGAASGSKKTFDDSD